MKSILSITLLSALTLTSSALTINKPRQAATSYAYTVTTVESTGVSTIFNPDANGIVSTAFSPSDAKWLSSANIYNPADNVQCTLRDQWGNQVRAFGGPSQDVNGVELVKADGIQVYSMFCGPA